jgi:hypothetical protein
MSNPIHPLSDPADEYAPDQPLPEIKEIVLEPRKLPLIDLLPYYEGTMQPIRPTVAEVLPELFLLYPGRTNSLHGEPSVGKTNVQLCMAKTILEVGGSILFIDPEDTPQGIATRARLLGVTADEIRRLFYLQNPAPDDYAMAHAWAAAMKPTAVFLDGLAEALAAEGKDENTPSDVLAFFRERTRPFADLGAAVLIADHVVKGEGNKRFARGSGAKLGSYNGAVYETGLGESYSPTKEGFVRLKVAKDRNGGVGAMGANVVELHFAPGPGGGTIAHWQTPPDPDSFRPTAIMDKIVKHLATFGASGKRDLRELGKHDYVDKAVEFLLADGKIIVAQSGQRRVFSLAEGGAK